MAEYRYTGNVDPKNGTDRIVLGYNKDGTPRKEVVLHGSIELTKAEHDDLSTRFVLEPVSGKEGGDK